MSEQEVQWGEWDDGDNGLPFRLDKEAGGLVDIQYADASYLNALEREVRDLRAKAALADEEWSGPYRQVTGRGSFICRGCGFPTHATVKHTAKCRKGRYDSLPSTSEGEGHESATAEKE